MRHTPVKCGVIHFLESEDTVLKHKIETRHIYHYFMHHAPHKYFPLVRKFMGSRYTVVDVWTLFYEKIKNFTISFYCYAAFTFSSTTKCPMLTYLISYNMQFCTIYSQLTKSQKSTTKGFHFTAFLIYFIQQVTCFIITRSL